VVRRVLQAPGLERACQREAIQRLQHALDHSQVSEADKPRTIYLLAELSRRSGDFAKAVDLFSQLDTNVDPDEEEAVLFANLSRKQLALAVVKSDINATISEEDLVVEREEE
jgi:ATP/maltotriose-dependent transcriptional regulator MalT